MIRKRRASGSSNAVLLTGNQTVAGVKTFSSAITSSVASGSNAASFLTGSRMSFGTNFISETSASAMQTSASTWSIAGAGPKLGYATTGAIINSSTNTAPQTTATLLFNMYASDVASGYHYRFRNPVALSTNINTFRALSFEHSTDSAAVETWSVRANGKMVLHATDASGTPGAATINRPSGQVAIAAGASSVTVTNSCVSTSSIVLATLQFVDATLTQILSVVPGAGSFVITGNTTATADTKIGFVVFN